MNERILNILPVEVYLFLKKIRYKSIVNVFRDELGRNNRFFNVHKGERCFIIANGPSTKGMDFSLFKDEITFTVNQMARNADFFKLKPNYHLWADRVFFEIDEDNPEDLEMLDIIKSVNRISPETEVFYEAAAQNMIDKFKLKESSRVNYFQVLPLEPRHMERTFIDFTNPIPNYPTVVDHAILLAVYMGFSSIYLVGCDCSGIVNIAMNKLKQAEDNLYSFELSENGAKRLERYSKQRSMYDELISQAAMLKTYEELDKYCKKNNVKLLNATKGGLLDSIKRVELDDLFK